MDFVKSLERLEANLSGLYSVLYSMKIFSQETKLVFQKIAMDSMEHEQLLKLLEPKLKSYSSAVSEEALGLAEDIAKRALELKDRAPKMSFKEIFEELRQLEKGEEIAYEIYKKIFEEASLKNDELLKMILSGIIEDEGAHDRLLMFLFESYK